jgi:hypothetical protein
VNVAVARDRRGFALESTLLLLVMFGALVGVATAAAVYTRTSGVDVRGTQVAYATEGAGDQIMSQLDAAMSDSVITPSDITAS